MVTHEKRTRPQSVCQLPLCLGKNLMPRCWASCWCSTGCWERLLVCGRQSRVRPSWGQTEYWESNVTRMDFIMTMATCLPAQARGPEPNGWKKRRGAWWRTNKRRGGKLGSSDSGYTSLQPSDVSKICIDALKNVAWPFFNQCSQIQNQWEHVVADIHNNDIIMMTFSRY